jgi:hypothetical protein
MGARCTHILLLGGHQSHPLPTSARVLRVYLSSVVPLLECSLYNMLQHVQVARDVGNFLVEGILLVDDPLTQVQQVGVALMQIFRDVAWHCMSMQAGQVELEQRTHMCDTR